MPDAAGKAIFFSSLLVVVLWHKLGPYWHQRTQKKALHVWLAGNNLLDFERDLHDNGIKSKEKFAGLDPEKFIAKYSSWKEFFTSTATRKERLKHGISVMKQHLLYKWLEEIELEKYFEHFVANGFDSVTAVERAMVEGVLVERLGGRLDADSIITLQALDEQTGHGRMGSTSTGIFILVKYCWWTVKFLFRFVSTLFGAAFAVGLMFLSVKHLKKNSIHHRVSILQYLLGHYLEPEHTKFVWNWTDPHVVGQAMSFRMEFYRRNSLAFIISLKNTVLVEIQHRGALVPCSVDVEGNKVQVTFTVRSAGNYSIEVLVQGKQIKGSPFCKAFLPGPVDPSKCSILGGASMHVVQKGIYTPLAVEAKDQFGNTCPISDQDLSCYQVSVTEIGQSHTIDPELVILPDHMDKMNVLHIKLERQGCFNAVVSYNGSQLDNGHFTIISLNEKEASTVQKNLKHKCWNVWYEVYLLTEELPAASSRRASSPAPLVGSHATQLPSPTLKKSHKVYCYISQKHLSIKEFYMKIIPHRLYAFRVRPTTKIILHPPDARFEQPVFTVDDGTQPPVLVMCKDRNVLLATFSKLLLSNIGGSESFKDKQQFFYQELSSYHGRKHGSVNLKIDRRNLLESSYAATKSFYTSDWCRSFNIKFKHEEGLDWGGVSREWFELVCKALFSHERGLFTRFKEDDPQALVHPNPKRPAKLKLKYYEFAGRIVGKCLYESSQGVRSRQNVKARFTRSFLAQLLGLRVSYRYFESDDKDFFRSKIKYIQENDPEDLGVVFAEEEYNSEGHIEQVVDLKPGGTTTAVTQENKAEYLDLLAQYRLSTRIQQEIEAFAKGLSEMVPDNLLSIFDEYELELLMCGTGSISVLDLKKNHIVNVSRRNWFDKVLDWFWTIVASFTQEELARLVQFTTGSSQLPPTGFAELSPRFSIGMSPTHDCLPTAHTCFNQICLPNYSSFETMQRMLVVAITEGSEGFGFA